MVQEIKMDGECESGRLNRKCCLLWVQSSRYVSYMSSNAHVAAVLITGQNA